MIRQLIKRATGCEHKSRFMTREIIHVSNRDGWVLEVWEKMECQDCGELLDDDIRSIAIEGEEIDK